MRLKTSACLILGMLRGGITSGYAIKRTVDRSTRFFWASSFAQIYPELKRLEESGHVLRREEPRGDRPRNAYELTEKGRHALDTWLRDEHQPLGLQIRDEGLLRLFFTDAVGHEDAVRLVGRLRERSEELEREIREEIFPLAEQAAQGGMIFPLITARLGADFQAWSAQWFGALEEELVGGRERRAG